jgi:homoserine dehydrogenase
VVALEASFSSDSCLALGLLDLCLLGAGFVAANIIPLISTQNRNVLHKDFIEVLLVTIWCSDTHLSSRRQSPRDNRFKTTVKD